ncbi:hypothetical protein GXB85_08870 [Cellulomonas sp. APG4]|uniref:hypothetical protein n=1 Tax=Cellulomonas sp. APG4 TaxID=1538656 RepID=UPI0013797239|nr:hypothetical protein [Cellulomonas sp. APG4]NCT91058.1 hypothetical protein [Cellulomonas sp. APG4]
MTDEMRVRFPRLYDFLESYVWSQAEGANLLGLLVTAAWTGHPHWSAELVDDLEGAANDDTVTSAELAELLTRVNERPYAVVTAENAKDVCASMAEVLRFVTEQRALADEETH